MLAFYNMVKYIGLRVAVLSGGAYKVTIPIGIFREVWKKLGDRKPKNVPLCFMKEDNMIMIEPVENVLEKKYPEEIKERVCEDLKKYLSRVVQEKLGLLIDNIVKGNIRGMTYYQMLDELRDNIDSVLKPYMRSVKGALSFTPDELESIIATATLEIEREKEEEFNYILDEIRGMIERKREIKKMLAILEEKSEIDRDLRKMIRERLLFELSIIEDRLKRVKSVLEEDE